jgi:hypothetical protein
MVGCHHGRQISLHSAELLQFIGTKNKDMDWMSALSRGRSSIPYKTKTLTNLIQTPIKIVKNALVN